MDGQLHKSQFLMIVVSQNCSVISGDSAEAEVLFVYDKVVAESKEAAAFDHQKKKQNDDFDLLD